MVSEPIKPERAKAVVATAFPSYVLLEAVIPDTVNDFAVISAVVV